MENIQIKKLLAGEQENILSVSFKTLIHVKELRDNYERFMPRSRSFNRSIYIGICIHFGREFVVRC